MSAKMRTVVAGTSCGSYKSPVQECWDAYFWLRQTIYLPGSILLLHAFMFYNTLD